MPAFLRLRLGGQLLAAMGTLAIGFVIYGLWSYNVIEELRIGGGLYQHITRDKDLIADVQPPPNFIIESYLTALQVARSESSAERDALVARLGHLESEYDARARHWNGEQLPGELNAILQRSEAPARRFFQTVHARLEPALAFWTELLRQLGLDERAEASADWPLWGLTAPKAYPGRI